MANVAIRWYNDLTAGGKRPNGHQTMNVTVFMVYNDLTVGRKRTGESKEGRKVGNAF